MGWLKVPLDQEQKELVWGSLLTLGGHHGAGAGASLEQVPVLPVRQHHDDFQIVNTSVRSLLGHSRFQAVSTLQADQGKLEVLDVKPAVCLVFEVT